MKPSEFKGNIPKEKFQLVERDSKIFDAKFQTKSITYLQDAWIRFRKNKASVAATWIIVLIILFGVLAPMVSKYSLSYSDAVYAQARPKVNFFERSGFWDGTNTMKLNDKYYAYIVGIGAAAEDKDGNGATWEEGINSKYVPLVSSGAEFVDKTSGKETVYRNAKVDTYYFVGFKFLTVTTKELEEIKQYEKDHDINILYPMIDWNSEFAGGDQSDANAWYLEKKGMPVDKDGKVMKLEDVKNKGFTDNYVRDANGNVAYMLEKDRSSVQIRVLYYNYYQYKNNGLIPGHTFGVDANGNDILVRLAHGIRLSLSLSIAVSFINFILGSIYGAVAGFYGGWVDMLLERFTDILNGMPFIIYATLFQLHLVAKGKVSVFGGLLFAFILTGWVGIGSRVRTQFYRFKRQEYILAARTLGAGDLRLMFKHIYPNAIGTIITSSALVIPGVILSESVLSFLGIVNFHGKDMASLGTMLGTAQGYLQTHPHILFFPAAVISLMMISFNLFGNGLRDAFNPSLRGAED